jgi:methionyl-tRNA formyltransferase
MSGISLMQNNQIHWALGGGKPQAIKIIATAIGLNLPPKFIIPTPDLPSADFLALSEIATRNNIPILSFQEIRESDLKTLDFLLTCRFPILPKKLFSAPKFGSVNFHNSLLPQYRGTHPVSWVLINDEKETGVTLHLIDEKIDNGPIIYQEKFLIEDKMNLWDLTEHLENLTCKIFSQFITHLHLYGGLPAMTVQEGIRSKAPRRHPEDSRIDFSHSARQIVKLIKALPTPLPSAFCYLDKTPIVFTDAELAEEFFSERCPEGTVQAKILPNIYVVKAKNSFIKVYCDHDIPIGSVLK